MQVPNFELMVELEILRHELCNNCGTYLDQHWVLNKVKRICPRTHTRDGNVLFFDDVEYENS